MAALGAAQVPVFCPQDLIKMWISFLFLWERVLLSARTESNQWPRPPSLAPLGQFTLRCAKGPPSVSAQPAAALTGGLPPSPHLRERVTLGFGYTPACKIKICFRPTLRPQGLSAIQICGPFHSIARRPLPAYLFGAAVVDGPAATVLPA